MLALATAFSAGSGSRLLLGVFLDSGVLAQLWRVRGSVEAISAVLFDMRKLFLAKIDVEASESRLIPTAFWFAQIFFIR